MRPVRVQATNFRSYRTLDLQIPEGASACVGANGAGKSSLLSTLLIGVYGAKGELSGCIRHGEDRVQVTVEVEHGGNVYRVRRAAGRKPVLDFEMWVDE